MNYEKSIYMKALESDRQKRKVARTYDTQLTELLRQSAVRAEKLTHDENWDVYLTRIQKEIENLDGIIQAAREQLESAAVVNHEKLITAKITLIEAEGMKKAFNIAISYPTEIIQAHKRQQA